MKFRIHTIFAVVTLMCGPVTAEEIASVDTAFKLLGANHKIVVEACDDPKVDGVTCFLAWPAKAGYQEAWDWQPTHRTLRSPAVRWDR